MLKLNAPSLRENSTDAHRPIENVNVWRLSFLIKAIRISGKKVHIVRKFASKKSKKKSLIVHRSRKKKSQIKLKCIIRIYEFHTLRICIFITMLIFTSMAYAPIIRYFMHETNRQREKTRAKENQQRRMQRTKCTM